MSKSGSLKKKKRRIFFRVYLSQACAQDLKVLRTAINCTRKAPVLQQDVRFLWDWICYPDKGADVTWDAPGQLGGFSYLYRWAQVSHRSCVTPPSLNRPLKRLRTSPMEGGNHALITEFHPIHLHTNLMQLYPRVCQKVSPDPGELFFPDTQWKVGLTIWEKKTQHFGGTDGFLAFFP